MTEPQRHKLVLSSAVTVALCLVLYMIIFGFHAFDPKSIIVVIGFFIMAWKVSTHKHKRNPLF
ncbi:MAG TPA: hypothetical protein PLL75_04870 [Candidatus Omnitrophota bacterium]|nr:hypothetical protein [Candidatus Omnitrophota bacterium]HPS37041.1 hypothetical protein [Candidatus Omnitrophota bacterium]